MTDNADEDDCQVLPSSRDKSMIAGHFLLQQVRHSYHLLPRGKHHDALVKNFSHYAPIHCIPLIFKKYINNT